MKLDELTEYKLLYQEKQNEVYRLQASLEGKNKEIERLKEVIKQLKVDRDRRQHEY